MPDEPLFFPSTTHIEVRCGKCKNVTEFRPDQLPKDITQQDFEARAVCKCGTKWPEVIRLPKAKSRW